MDLMLSEDTNKQLLSKEWAVKIDVLNSKPYLIKFCSSTKDVSCTIVITDTISVWTEALSSQQFARRWRECNVLDPVTSVSSNDEEDQWRIHNLDVLTKVHTPGCIADCSFETIETKFSDVAFDLDASSFQWRWETCFIGYKASAEFLSKHLIFPLISLTHLSFSPSDNIHEMSDADMNKAVDKVGRTSRRNVDIHVKNVISKPRVSSALSRLTATFNFSADIPPVTSSYETYELEVLPPPKGEKTRSSPPDEDYIPTAIKSPPNSSKIAFSEAKAKSPSPVPPRALSKGRSPAPPVVAPDSDSATEPDSDEELEPPKASTSTSNPTPKVATPPIKSPTPAPRPNSRRPTQAPSSDTDSPPARKPPPKRTRPPASSSDDSDDDRKKNTVKRGTRQPIKRGGKRF